MTLTPGRRQTLEAVVSRILPGIDGPGAADTAVAVAFEDALQHRYLRGVRRGIEQLLDRLQSQAGERFAREFSACAPDDQDALISGLERDANPWTRLLFQTVIGLTLEGLLGDPVHGGNRECRGWHSIGLTARDVRSGLCRGVRED